MTTPLTIRFYAQDLDRLEALKEAHSFTTTAEAIRYGLKVAHELDLAIEDLRQRAIATQAAQMTSTDTEEA